MKNMYPVGNIAKDKIEIPSKKIIQEEKEHFFQKNITVCLTLKCYKNNCWMNVLLMNESGG